MEESSIFEDVDSKFLNAPSWQLESKLARFTQEKPSTSHVCFRLCVMPHVLSLWNLGPDATRYAYPAWSDGTHLARYYFMSWAHCLRPRVVQISLWLTEAFCFLCRLSVWKDGQSADAMQSISKYFSYRAADRHSEHEVHDIDTKPLLLYH